MEEELDEEEEGGEAEETEEGCGCYGCCRHEPCGRCMDCLGLSWRDFF